MPYVYDHPTHIHSKSKVHMCCGIVTTDVLVKGLSRGAIATRKLKGVNWNKGHERFILVWPLAVKVKPSPVDVVLLGFEDQGAKHASVASRSLVFYPNPPPGRPLIYTG